MTLSDMFVHQVEVERLQLTMCHPGRMETLLGGKLQDTGERSSRLAELLGMPVKG